MSPFFSKTHGIFSMKKQGTCRIYGAPSNIMLCAASSECPSTEIRFSKNLKNLIFEGKSVYEPSPIGPVFLTLTDDFELGKSESRRIEWWTRQPNVFRLSRRVFERFQISSLDRIFQVYNREQKSPRKSATENQGKSRWNWLKTLGCTYHCVSGTNSLSKFSECCWMLRFLGPFYAGS